MSATQSQWISPFGDMKVISVDWTAETSGAFTSYTITGCAGMYLLQVETIPNQERAPTGNYDLTLTDVPGLGATGATIQTISNQSATAAEVELQAQVTKPLDTDLVLAITGNSVDRAKGRVKLYLCANPCAIVAAA